MIILDASVVGALLIPDEDDRSATDLLLKLSDPVLCPPHFLVETASLCLKAIRRGRLTDDKQARALQVIDLVNDRTRPTAFPVPAVIALAQRHGLSAYDAAYLWLSLDRKAPLLTIDGPLLRVAQKLGVAA